MDAENAPRTAAVGVVEHGNSAVFVTVGPDGGMLDRRRADLTHGLPTHPYHHEGSWAVGRYVNSSWARPTTIREAVALVERVQEAAAEGARRVLADLEAALPTPVGVIALRICPDLPPTILERITDSRAANMADLIMYRQAIANAAAARGWRVSWYERDAVLKGTAQRVWGQPISTLIAAMGRCAGAPWRAEHKLAAGAAISALAN